MNLQEIQHAVLTDHVRLREMLQEVEGLAEQVEKSEKYEPDILREQGRQLYHQLKEHLNFEERVLLPRLRDAGPEERERALRLQADHAEQQELLRFLLTRIQERARPTLLIARELVNFSQCLHEDLRNQEEVIWGASPPPCQ